MLQGLDIVKQAKVVQLLNESGDKRRGSSSGKERASRRGSRESLESMQYEGEEVSETVSLLWTLSY